jgi:pimeloyl-ACP methyl ester carboxylesterase
MARESPRDRFVEIPRAVHTLHEDNPEAVLDALREFLGSCGWYHALTDA